MTRLYLRALQGVAVIGLVLSVMGFFVEAGVRLDRLMNAPWAFPGPFAGVRHCLDGAKQAGEPLLLSALLAVACEIALRLVPRKKAPTDHPRGDDDDHPG